MTINRVKEAVAAYKTIEAEKCPFETDHLPHGSAKRDELQAQRSEWFTAHWPREQAAKKEMDRRLGTILAKRGVRIRTDGCGCCDSPRLTVFLDDEFICDEGNWYFDNLEGREVPK